MGKLLDLLMEELAENGNVEYKELLVKAASGTHTKAPANFNTAQLLTEPGGMFTVPGADNVVISAFVRPMGFGARLPAINGNIDDPRFPIITGVTGLYGSRPNLPCDDGPTSSLKSGLLTAQFGRVLHQTATIEIDTLLHRQRGASTDLRLLGQMVTGGNMGPFPGDQNTVLNNVVASEMVKVGVQFERDLSRMLWTGTPDNNTAGGGHKEFPGLDSQIATGQIDAETGTAMPAADSYIDSFGYSELDSTTKDIVEYLSYMEANLFHIAERTGMAPVTWDIVMRPELWYELSSYWPCRYNTNRCSNLGGSNPVVINDDANIRMRDDMRRGMYIDINGRRYSVVTDDGIFEYNNANSASVPRGEFASSIYMVPRLVNGNFPVTYWEHIDYRQISSIVAPIGAGIGKLQFWTENGRFLWVIRPNGMCFDLQAKVEARVVLRAPHLAGKLQHVRYSPMSHLRSPYPDSPYNFNGGVSLRPIPAAGQAVWK